MERAHTEALALPLPPQGPDTAPYVHSISAKRRTLGYDTADGQPSRPSSHTTCRLVRVRHHHRDFMTSKVPAR